jgi:hypothetical protein
MLLPALALAAATMAGYVAIGNDRSAASPTPPVHVTATVPLGAPPAPSAISTAAAAPSGPVQFPWLATTSGGQPVSWPCGPIGYRVVLEGAPAGAQEVVAQAFDRISAVSGYQVREDPSLDHRVPENDPAYLDIIVAWVPGGQFPQGTGGSDVIGRGGASYSGNSPHYTYGNVRVNRDWPGSTRTDFGPQSVGPLLLHELGHTLGLAHTNDPQAIMYPTDEGVSTWSPPEVTALKYLHDSCGVSSPTN